MIDPILNASIRHGISLTHYSNYVLRRMIALLNKTDTDMSAALLIALDGIDAVSFKVQRLDKLLASVRELNAQAYAALYAGLTAELQAYVAYEGQFQYDLYKSVAPVTFSIAAVVPEQAYAASMSVPMQGRLLKEWASGLESNRLRRIKDAIAIGFTSGKTTDEIVREIRGTKAAGYADGLLDMSRREVESIVRTSISHTAQMVRTRFYDDNEDILGDIVWVSTLDSRTSSPCRARDHLHYTQSHAPVGHSVPWEAGPGRLHWNCRSSSIAMLKGQKRLTGTRSAADGPADVNTSYRDWLKQQPANVQDDVLGKAKGERYRKDGMSDAAFVNNKGLEISLKRMVEMDAAAFGK